MQIWYIAILLRFGVQNHLSFRDHQDLSLVASSLKDDERGLLYSAALDAERLLPATLIYGANASGKSNLLDSLAFMRRAVLESHRLDAPGDGVQRKPFALDNTARATPSKYDIDFIVHEIRYHYGFEASDDAYTSEWLYAFPNNHRQKLFERTGAMFSFGRNLRGHNELIRGLTRANSLFLAARTTRICFHPALFAVIRSGSSRRTARAHRTFTP